MKLRVIFLFCFTIIFFNSSKAQLLDRFSSNKIPKLNFAAIELSESIEAAKEVYENFFKEEMGLELTFECYVDSTYKRLKERQGFDISLFGKSLSGKKFESNVDSELELNANLQTFLIIDRKRNVRAFSQVSTIDHQQYAQVIEELLLNINGEEIITVDSEEPETAFGWQTSLGKENYEKENEGKLVIDFGASENYWYKYLGEKLPDFKVYKYDGTEIKFSDLHDNKVTVLYIYEASNDEKAKYFTTGITIGLMFAESIYRSFVLGEAEPGDEYIDNATYAE